MKLPASLQYLSPQQEMIDDAAPSNPTPVNAKAKAKKAPKKGQATGEGSTGSLMDGKPKKAVPPVTRATAKLREVTAITNDAKSWEEKISMTSDEIVCAELKEGYIKGIESRCANVTEAAKQVQSILVSGEDDGLDDEITKLEQCMEKYNSYISKTIKPQF
ncbi:unnamed protein product, partial [Symbiodinium sp. CCMP2456]